MGWSTNGGGVAVNTKVLKILAIGNSFSDDATDWLYSIAKSAGVEIIVGALSMGGQSLQGHMEQVTGNLSAYTYTKHSAQGVTSAGGKSMESGLIDEAWDIITLQQVSNNSGKYETFQPYLNDLIAYIKTKATNPKLQFGLHCTWAYAVGSSHGAFPDYGSNQVTMYNAICDAYLKAMKETDISIVIPSGTSIQNARSSVYLEAVGDDMTRDSYHLDLGMGRYTAGLAWFETLVAPRYGKDIFTDVTFKPSLDADDTQFNAYLAKVAVKTAKANPFKVTAI